VPAEAAWRAAGRVTVGGSDPERRSETDGVESTRRELRRRMRLLRLSQAITSALIASLFRSAYGILAGALLVALGS